MPARRVRRLVRWILLVDYDGERERREWEPGRGARPDGDPRLACTAVPPGAPALPRRGRAGDEPHRLAQLSPEPLGPDPRLLDLRREHQDGTARGHCLRDPPFHPSSPKRAGDECCPE